MCCSALQCVAVCCSVLVVTGGACMWVCTKLLKKRERALKSAKRPTNPQKSPTKHVCFHTHQPKELTSTGETYSVSSRLQRNTYINPCIYSLQPKELTSTGGTYSVSSCCDDAAHAPVQNTATHCNSLQHCLQPKKSTSTGRTYSVSSCSQRNRNICVDILVSPRSGRVRAEV